MKVEAEAEITVRGHKPIPGIRDEALRSDDVSLRRLLDTCRVERERLETECKEIVRTELEPRAERAVALLLTEREIEAQLRLAGGSE